MKPEHEITIRYRVPLDAFDTEVHAHTLAESIITKLNLEFPGRGTLRIPYVRVGKPSIVRNGLGRQAT